MKGRENGGGGEDLCSSLQLRSAFLGLRSPGSGWPTPRDPGDSQPQVQKRAAPSAYQQACHSYPECV